MKPQRLSREVQRERQRRTSINQVFDFSKPLFPSVVGGEKTNDKQKFLKSMKA
jgi:hypothetical protein